MTNSTSYIGRARRGNFWHTRGIKAVHLVPTLLFLSRSLWSTAASLSIRGSAIMLPPHGTVSSLVSLSILLNWSGLYLKNPENSKNSRNHSLGARQLLLSQGPTENEVTITGPLERSEVTDTALFSGYDFQGTGLPKSAYLPVPPNSGAPPASLKSPRVCSIKPCLRTRFPRVFSRSRNPGPSSPAHHHCLSSEWSPSASANVSASTQPSNRHFLSLSWARESGRNRCFKNSINPWR